MTSNPRQDSYEERAIALLQQVVAIDAANADALPGTAVKHVKDALVVMKKRRRTAVRAAAVANARRTQVHEYRE